jgi:acyl dehydratase
VIDASFIGWRADPATVEVEKGQLRLFAQAVGETDRIYFDEAAAEAAGFASLPAPPTFAFCLKNLVGQPYSYLRMMGVDIAHLLHGEQAFEHHEPIYAGDTVTLTTEILNIEQKKGGALGLITAQTDVASQCGQLCVRLTTTLVVRKTARSP